MKLLKRKDKKEHYRYTSAEEIIKDVSCLKDWKKECYRKSFLKFLSKISILLKGYKYINENGKEVKGTYPSEVFEAIAKICKESGKFPREENLYQAHTRTDIDYVEKLHLVTSEIAMIGLYEQTDISEIAKSQFGINIEEEPASQSEVEQLINSCEKFLDISKAKKYFKILHPNCDMENLNIEQKNEIDFFLEHLDEINNAINHVSLEFDDFSVGNVLNDRLILQRALTFMGVDVQGETPGNNKSFCRETLKNALFNKRINSQDISKIKLNRGEKEIVE